MDWVAKCLLSSNVDAVHDLYTCAEIWEGPGTLEQKAIHVAAVMEF